MQLRALVKQSALGRDENVMKAPADPAGASRRRRLTPVVLAVEVDVLVLCASGMGT
jgi:hypothetical protein